MRAGAAPPLSPCPPVPRDLSLIAEAMGRSDFLRRLGEGCPEALAQSFVPVQHGPGDTVLAEGDEGNAMYIVAGGSGHGARAGVCTCPLGCACIGARIWACCTCRGHQCPVRAHMGLCCP